MNRQGTLSSRCPSGTKCSSRQLSHGNGCATSQKLGQMGESSKMAGARHGVFGERPYPPSRRKFSSNRRTSRISRPSFAIGHLRFVPACQREPAYTVYLITGNCDFTHTENRRRSGQSAQNAIILAGSWNGSCDRNHEFL